MRALMLALLVSAALAGPALAQGTAQGTAKPAPKPSETKAARSPLAGVAFPIQPYPLEASEMYGEFIGKAAKDNGRRCQGLEVYGWEFKKGDQSRLSEIVDTTMNAVEKSGYKLTQVKAPSLESPNSVPIVGDKAKKRLMMVWAPVADAVMLLICDASAAAKK
ncbi:hypothetical protein HL658_11145 [Azospirillum sp. RWY-5-1]|uniref:Uncharacterized protein n=1 Tax=Azospirillum oleiclasticum TaxID=2735135 RepID=A0ABX2T7D6_9PROT|nr:hypothetical protein [Azospirillum oleiclasticum]NYZ13111.1 hypothetical protein [Azospirillum oleiclasticum]NYZ20216.1 hypothetical protein [Azospirillum oleiclasticum]